MLSQYLTPTQFLALGDAEQWHKRWVDAAEIYTRPFRDEKGRKLTVVLSFDAERLKLVGLYYALPTEADFPDIYGRRTPEFTEFHEKVLTEELGDNASEYAWYQFPWGIVRNEASHIRVCYGLKLRYDPTLKTKYRFNLWQSGYFPKRRKSDPDRA